MLGAEQTCKSEHPKASLLSIESDEEKYLMQAVLSNQPCKQNKLKIKLNKLKLQFKNMSLYNGMGNHG